MLKVFEKTTRANEPMQYLTLHLHRLIALP